VVGLFGSTITPCTPFVVLLQLDGLKFGSQAIELLPFVVS
jgi:hypothetical protein